MKPENLRKKIVDRHVTDLFNTPKLIRQSITPIYDYKTACKFEDVKRLTDKKHYGIYLQLYTLACNADIILPLLSFAGISTSREFSRLAICS